MSKIRTLGDLDDALDEDLAWRRTELHSLLASARVAKGPTGACLLRAGLALMYAHWEGYTKRALGDYWTFVAMRRLTYGQLGVNFVALGIERELRRAQGMSETTGRIARVTRVLNCNDDRALMSDREIDTQSNLSSEVLVDLFARLGIDFPSSLSTKSHFIDFSLLSNRNRVAHGEYLGVEIEAYEDMHREVLGLLDLVRTTVSNAASTQRYLRTPGGRPPLT